MKIDMDSKREEKAEIKSLCNNLEHRRPSPFSKLLENSKNEHSHNVQVPFNIRSTTHTKVLNAQERRLLETMATIENGIYVSFTCCLLGECFIHNHLETIKLK